MASQKPFPNLPHCRSAFAFRRSPSLTSSSPPPKIKPISMKSLLKKPPLFNSDALALSLYVNGNEENQDQPTPLKMYDNSSAEKSVRRSPRVLMREVGVKWLRSRMVPMHLDGSALSIESPSKKANIFSEVCFRRKQKTNLGNSHSNVFGGRCSRSRKVPVLLVDEHGETKSKSVVKRKLKEKSKSAFGSCDLGVLGKKCLRSRTIPFQLVGIEDVESKRVLIELPGVLRDKKQQEEIKTNSGCFDLDGIAEKKCLRSKKVPICVVGTEKEDTKPGLIALPVSLGMKSKRILKQLLGAAILMGLLRSA
ncbi:hypothetical protein LOK49_LG11G01976 [Camellia lanceoleosa]|uniref:Uncharacterized protein n=1 Tax=Camellia lanceoleosa TaxID=1840588 RepID=A0ACC0FYZ9_9ERIC|nr:hypothetical protein LOK49_LG11G01976 [Camellia lanceoleosa]